MSRALVTGAAGFIGSHLCEALLSEGWAVRGVDSFNDFYDPGCKSRNIAASLDHPGFELIRSDLSDLALGDVLDGADAMPRQRPDMAAHRFIEALLDGGPITVFGDGGQVRDYSYVGDVVNATVRSLSADLPPAAVFDIASGNPVEHAEGWAPASSTSYASTEQQRTALL